MACTAPSFGSIEEILVSTFHFADQSQPSASAYGKDNPFASDVPNIIHALNARGSANIFGRLLLRD
jgi:hypothetical protein